MVCYEHGILGIVDISLVFKRYSEEGVNQGSGVVGARVLEMWIFHWLYKHYGATA